MKIFMKITDVSPAQLFALHEFVESEKVESEGEYKPIPAVVGSKVAGRLKLCHLRKAVLVGIVEQSYTVSLELYPILECGSMAGDVMGPLFVSERMILGIFQALGIFPAVEKFEPQKK